MVTLSIHTNNDLKKCLEAVERSTMFLEFSGNLWKDGCSCFKKEWNKSLVSGECSHLEHPTPSTSASQNRLKPVKRMILTADKNLNCLKKDLLAMDLSPELGSYFYQFFNNFTCLAHHYVLVVCEACWFTMQTGICWDSNEIASKKGIVRDGRGLCFRRLILEQH